ncbi:MAG: PD-(D/E)XK nuclease family protein [Candidatus Woesearchaeota archaeon]
MIVHKSFKHGWFYHYRIHIPKAEELCNNKFYSLKKYLLDVKEYCPDDYFYKGPRGSALRINTDLDVKRVKNHEVSKLASLGLESKKFNTAHSNVQMFMLQNDTKTISIEVPIWLLSTELSGYNDIFETDEPLTGHIDVLRIEDEKIWIWDYKPNAFKEKYASIQTNFYAIMLSKRTGIPLEYFRCGYFDDIDAFIFKPKLLEK